MRSLPRASPPAATGVVFVLCVLSAYVLRVCIVLSAVARASVVCAIGVAAGG